MGEWIIGAVINVTGSVAINFGTNLLKLGHNQRERLALVEASESGEKSVIKKSITQFRAWRIGVVVFTLGNCLNFISFGYAAQDLIAGQLTLMLVEWLPIGNLESPTHLFNPKTHYWSEPLTKSLLAALGSVQFVSNVFFAYVMLNEIVTSWILLATLCIVIGNAFLVAFGNHQSAIYTHEQLLASYKGNVYLVYCAVLILLVIIHHAIYRRGRKLISSRGEDGVGACWRMLLPFSYAIVSGAIGTHSVLFAKSLSILLRLTMNGDSQLDGWFTYLVFFLFVGTASFWMARLNDGLAMFDAILIVPMLQIVWTFFSIFTGFIYFEEYLVFDGFQATMFGVGICALFLGMSLLAPQGSKGSGTRMMAGSNETEFVPLMGVGSAVPIEQREPNRKSLVQHVCTDAARVVGRAKSACRMSLGLGQDGIHTSSVFAMPMIASSRIQWRTPTLNSEWLARLTDPPTEVDVSAGIPIVRL